MDKPKWRVQPKTRVRARSLRRDFTRAEKTLWAMVRAHRLQGASFRRQTPIGPYIVDFVSHSARLVIEVDGGQHFEEKHLKADARRDAFLASKGYRVLRFTNLDVLKNREGVFETIASALKEAPSLTLPRKREREQAAAGGETMP
ncbi:MAG: endonuclease domain-containing protein [Variibacter sp.]